MNRQEKVDRMVSSGYVAFQVVRWVIILAVAAGLGLAAVAFLAGQS
jgi:hypothetical protein